MKDYLALFIVGAVNVFCAPSPTGNLSNIVSLFDGTVQGSPRDSSGILSFKGILYAAPPVGNLRWRSPEPAVRWNDVRNATQFGYRCWSALEGSPVPVPPSEDCLTVNIWTGAQQAAEKRAVMVWFYGGGFQFGNSAQSTYNGTNFAQDGVVLVSFNYRLGVFGFLALPELDSEGHPSGDFGLQDQLAALRWVRKNIAAFGGDPDNVTVFGESAGAHAVGLLTASPLSHGLFHKVILESGAYWDSEHGSLSTFDEARQVGSAWERRLNATSVADFRGLSAQAISNASQWNPNTDPGITTFSPSIDNYVLPTAPAQVFDLGRQLRVPMLAGWNTAEEFLFLSRALPHGSAAQFRAAASLQFGNRTAEFLTLYPADTDAQANASANALVGDLIIREQTSEAADRQSRIADLPVYVYYFTYTSPYSPIAAHTSELPFVFGNLAPPTIFGGRTPAASEQDRTFSQQIMAYWTNFAKYADPNVDCAGLPYWPRYDSGGADILQLSNVTAPVNYNLDRFKFLASLRTDGLLPTSWRTLNV